MKEKLDLVLLAGGKGTRINKYLNGHSKPMVKINNQIFLSLIIKYFSKYIFGNIYILAGYKGEEIKKRFHGKFFNFCEVKVIVEKKLLGTGGALNNIKKKINNNFVLMNADTFFPINIKEFIQKSNKRKMINIALTNKKFYLTNKKLTNLKIDTKNNLSETKLKTKYMNGGIYYVNKKLLSKIKNKKFSLENDLIPKLIKKKLINGLYFRNKFIDIGTPKNLHKSKKFLKNFFNKPAIIFDRDNTLIKDNGYTYKVKDLFFKKNIIQILKFIQKKSIFIFIVTNQAGIAKAKFTIKDFYKFQNEIKKKLYKENIFLDDVKFCPYHPNGKIRKYKKRSQYRKPGNLMIKELKDEWSFNLKKSLVVGDSISDKKMADKSFIEFTYPDKNLLGFIKKKYF